ncbi:hypothetical protein [Gilvimarinus sp. 1_MG-2023]|uniref:hypothetical protein n=1 Tax=Gilvimarinus sp. 1_MG-2023 TaxID=3062638 RepID=UPI0026E1B3D2|nr:hypothetical protein [Gilvimarinus sp. 1_MG-2023]MDO6746700.1 hypothetical protein [Gilvimarinus sp. 1_MG-2023]
MPNAKLENYRKLNFPPTSPLKSRNLHTFNPTTLLEIRLLLGMVQYELAERFAIVFRKPTSKQKAVSV